MELFSPTIMEDPLGILRIGLKQGRKGIIDE